MGTLSAGSAVMENPRGLPASVIEEILSCQTLPSLPAVALRVIELTRNPNVSMDDLAQTVQNDQALAAKILRTVNSSFYGLRKRCASIRQALVMMGLGPVKALTLGFSLVTSAEGIDDGFNKTAYWRRSLYSAVAARAVAESAGMPNLSDEAFLAALLQDIGMMAMYQALRERYAEVIAEAGGDHARVASCELRAFDTQHAEIGAMLAQRWRLPESLVMPVRYHERPTAAPQGHHLVVRLVSIGNLAHDVLTEADPLPSLRRYMERCEQWFSLKPLESEEILRRIGGATRELAGLFNVDAGRSVSAAAILDAARNQHIEVCRAGPDTPAVPGSLGEAILRDGGGIDTQTGAYDRAGFDASFRRGFEAAVESGESVGVVVLSVDVGAGPAQLSGASLIEALAGVVATLRRHLDPLGAVVCRIQPSLIGAVVPGSDAATLERVVDAARRDIEKSSPGWGRSRGLTLPRVRTTAGVAVRDPNRPGPLTKPEHVVAGAASALRAALGAGGSCVRAYSGRAEAA